jgi:hypothetical protein
MASSKNYWVSPKGTSWEVKSEGSDETRSFTTQAEAWQFAMDRAKAAGGEAYLKDEQGQVRERNTYGQDPRSIPG